MPPLLLEQTKVKEDNNENNFLYFGCKKHVCLGINLSKCHITMFLISLTMKIVMQKLHPLIVNNVIIAISVKLGNLYFDQMLHLQ